MKWLLELSQTSASRQFWRTFFMQEFILYNKEPIISKISFIRIKKLGVRMNHIFGSYMQIQLQIFLWFFAMYELFLLFKSYPFVPLAMSCQINFPNMIMMDLLKCWKKCMDTSRKKADANRWLVSNKLKGHNTDKRWRKKN